MCSMSEKALHVMSRMQAAVNALEKTGREGADLRARVLLRTFSSAQKAMLIELIERNECDALIALAVADGAAKDCSGQELSATSRGESA